MKLVAEQVKLLRKKREELLKSKREYSKYLSESRERDSIDGTTPFYADYLEGQNYQRTMKELHRIEDILSSAELVIDRNFDSIEVGTAFYAQFDGDDEKERITLVESDASMGHDFHLVSLDSDFGKAIQGHTDGDYITYTVKATGRKIGVSIDSIDRMKNHYDHYIREVSGPSRMSKVVKSELRELKQANPEEYKRRHGVSYSQIELAEEELKRESDLTPTRKAFLNRIIHSTPEALPTDGSIGIGSHVQVLLTDEAGRTTIKDFEMINRAVSYELDDHYVERITPLGNAIYGLRANDTFTVSRNHKPNLQGVVLMVQNDLTKQSQRVL